MPLIFFNMLWEMGTLGLPNIVTYLEQKGYPSKHVYLTKHELETPAEIQTILAFVEREQPRLVGFSLMSFNFERTRRITLAIKQRFPDLPIVWGGIHPTFDPQESIQYADFVCVGEGEDATLELVQAIEAGADAQHIPNIWSKHAGQVFQNDVRPLIQNLDDYPFPYINWQSTYVLDEGEIRQLTHTLYRKYVQNTGTMYDIMASRGCPYACSYCCNALFRKIYKGKGRYVRYRSVDNLITELQYAMHEFPYINMVNIQDDGFASAPEAFLKEFSEKYKDLIGLPLRLRVIPTMFTDEKARYLAEANTLVAILGIQTSDRINREKFNRRVSAETVLKVAEILHRHNIFVQYDLIVRNPYETEDDLVEVCRILARIPRPYHLIMYPLALFPNTPLRLQAIADGIEVNNRDGIDTPFGNFPNKYPYLLRLQEASPYTPARLIHFFLDHRREAWVRGMFNVYYYVFFKGIELARKLVMKNTRMVGWVKKLLFLPNSFKPAA